MTIIINGYEYENITQISFDTEDDSSKNIWVLLTHADGSYETARANYFLMDTVIIRKR